MAKKKPLTNAMLDKIYNKLCEEGGAVATYDKGRPVYSMAYYGTPEEIKEMKRRLIEIATHIQPPNL